jgi:hypothetical protein
MITSRLKQNGILLKMIVLICGLITMLMLVKPASAVTNENYDSSKATTCSTAYPFWTQDPGYDSSSSQVYAEMATAITYGTTINGCGMGHGSSHSHWYSGWANLYVNGDFVYGKGATGSNYKVSASGTAVSQGDSDYVAMPLDTSKYLKAVKPSITSSGFEETGSTTGEVYASAEGGSSSLTWRLDLTVQDWYGPGDNNVTKGIVCATGSGTISVTDTVVSYEYEFSKSGRSGSGKGSTFSHSANIEEAGGYCKVTFYTEKGSSVSTKIPIPYKATLTYDGNGNGDTVTNVPSSVTAWENYYVTISSQVPKRNNYIFMGWNTSSSYAEMPYNTTSAPYNTYTGGDYYRLSDNTTLYAVWKQVKVPYNLYFTLNGQSISNDYVYVTGYVNNSCRVSNGWAFSALEIPGYSIRYTATPTNSNAVYIISGSSNSRTVSSDTYDMVACGTIHTITYSANGGTYGTDEAGNELAGPEDQTRYYGKNLYLTSTVPTRVGYTFAGWKSNRTGITFSAGGLYGTGSTAYSSWMRGGTETMVAQWEVMS